MNARLRILRGWFFEWWPVAVAVVALAAGVWLWYRATSSAISLAGRLAVKATDDAKLIAFSIVIGLVLHALLSRPDSKGKP